MMQDVINLMIFLFALLVMFTVALGVELRREDVVELSSNTCGFDTAIEYKAAVRLHTYHGTLTSYVDEHGTCLFLRDGEVCSLYDPLTRTDR